MAKRAQTQTGSKAIRAIFADAARAAEQQALADDPDPNLPRDGILPGQWPGWPDNQMPPGDPVQVIGRSPDGGTYYFLSATGHFREVTRWDGRALTDLYAPFTNKAKWNWPAFGKKKVFDPDSDSMVEKAVVKRVERDQAFDCLMNEAARKPDFDPNKQNRGRGGWQDNAGRFIWHSGGWLWTVSGQGAGAKLERSRPAQHDGFLYTRQAPTVEPWEAHVTQEESPARRILKDLRTWKWERPFLDPVLVLGWIGTAIMGGALRQRPVVFTTGGAGVGKSTLQELLIGALGDIVTSTVNTTAAGIYQRAKLDSLPFMVDELESKAGSTRADSVIELARVAYTGGDISRGGQDHEATTFTARQSFFFSAINAPPMNTQDKTRMALLNLQRLDRANGVDRKPEFSDVDSRMMLRQVLDGWHEFYPRLYQNYWEELAPQGLDSRAINTFGTLLAAAELLVGPAALEECGLPVGDVDRLGEMVAAATALERAENLDNWHKCLDLLFQASIDQWRDGIKPTVGGICEALRTGKTAFNDTFDVTDARARLQLANLSAIARGKLNANPQLGPLLAVPANGPILQRIFADTEFHKSVWYTALKQAPRDIVLRDLGNAQKVKINGSTVHCLLVDLEAFEKFATKGE